MQLQLKLLGCGHLHFHNRPIDLQQVYLLQSEALKYKTLMFICEYFRHHTRVKHNRSQLIVCLTLESKVLQERIHKQHLCAKQKKQ